MTKITDQFRQRLSANAEDFDGIVAQILATMEEQEAQIAAMRDALEFYAHKASYSSSWAKGDERHAMECKGVVARQALTLSAGKDLLEEVAARRSGNLLPDGWNEYGLALGVGKGWVYGKTDALIALQDMLNAAAIPPGYQLAPIAPTEDQKADCMGEVKFPAEKECTACHYHEPQDDCEVCGGKVQYTEMVTVPWTAMKKVYRLMLAAGKPVSEDALQDMLASALDWHPASEEPRDEGSYVLFSICDGFHVAEFVFYGEGGTSGFFHCFGGDVPDHVAWAKLVDPQALERQFGSEDAA